VRADPWLGERLGRPAFTLEEGDDPRALRGPGFYQAKVGGTDVERVQTLEDAGFRLVDVNVTLRRAAGALSAPDGVAVAAARPEQREAVLEIAADHFGVSRFHMDPAIPAATASAIKRDWAAAVLDGQRGEGMLVAAAGEAVVGFLALAAGPAIDLVAVRTEARRVGAGRALVAAVADRELTVGTQVANTGALRFYERLGFTTVGIRYVLHLHRA
jgi:ribosomal protein S18 acetylase RimI-like enzyme